MKVNKKDMGRRVKKARQQKNLTQDQLAEIIGTSTAHISHIENARGNASIDTIIDIMDALDLSPNELFCGTVETAKPHLLTESVELLNQFSTERVNMYNRQWEMELEEKKERERNK